MRRERTRILISIFALVAVLVHAFGTALHHHVPQAATVLAAVDPAGGPTDRDVPEPDDSASCALCLVTHTPWAAVDDIIILPLLPTATAGIPPARTGAVTERRPLVWRARDPPSGAAALTVQHRQAGAPAAHAA
jgi:hypothetical protein